MSIDTPMITRTTSPTRSPSAASQHDPRPSSPRPSSPRPPSPPSLTYHHPHLISLPTPGLLSSVASGAHYSGVDPVKERRLSLRRNHSAHEHAHAHRASVAGDTGAALLAGHEAVLNDLKEMYEGRATAEIMERRWSRNAKFEDPLVKCKGLSEIAPQFFALPQLFSQCTTLGRRVLTSSKSPNRLIVWQKQEYTSRITGHKKIVESILVADLDADDKIVRLVDQWKGEAPPTRWGAGILRRVNGVVVHWLPWLGRVPKDH